MAFIRTSFAMLAIATVALAIPTLRYKREGQSASSASNPLDSITANLPQGFNGANSPLSYEQYLEQFSSFSNAFPTGSLPAVGSFPAFGQSSTRKKREESAAANPASALGSFANLPQGFNGANSPLSYEQYLEQFSSLSNAFPTGSLPAVGSFPAFGQSSTRKKREESAAANPASALGSFANLPQGFNGANSPLSYEQYLEQFSSLSNAFPTGSLPAVGSFPAFGQSSTRKKREESAAANPASALGSFANLPQGFNGANSPLSYEQYLEQFSSLSNAFPTGSLPAVGSFPAFGKSSTRKNREESAAASPNPFAELFSPDQIEKYMNNFQQFSGSFPTGSLPTGNLPSLGSASTSS